MTVKKIFPWIAAVFTVIVWSETFVSTKILLEHSLSPAEIFLARFSLAYAGMLLLCHKKLFSESFKDELRLFAMGVIGGSLYFLAENTALEYSSASNVAILVGTAPLSTALILGAVYKEEKSSPRQVLGSVITFLGMALVVFNGQFVLHLNPKGDMLAIGASVCWGLYALILKKISAKYDILFITRKVFAYGIISMGVFLLLTKSSFAPVSVLLRPQVWGNLLYLSLIASLLCFIAWNWSITQIGIVRATNLIYGQCFFTMAFAAVILGERITLMAIIGTAVLISGMILALHVSDNHRTETH